MNKRIYLRTTIKNLFALSGNRCAWPGCSERIVCLESGEVFGEIRHIRSGATDGPRHDPDYPLEKINKPENLVLMCRPHHKDIDSDDGIYPTAVIIDVKAAHQANMRSQLELPENSAEYFATLLEQLKYTYRRDPQLSELVLHDQHVVTAIMANTGGSLLIWSIGRCKHRKDRLASVMRMRGCLGEKICASTRANLKASLSLTYRLFSKCQSPKEEWKFLSVSKTDGGRELKGPHYQFCRMRAIRHPYAVHNVLRYDNQSNLCRLAQREATLGE
ncbi:hypothetical protein [Rhizobium mongolense]